MIDGRVRVTFGEWWIDCKGAWRSLLVCLIVPSLAWSGCWLYDPWAMYIKNPLSCTCGHSYLFTSLYICYVFNKITKDFVIFMEWHQCKNYMSEWAKTQQESLAPPESSRTCNFSKYLNAHDFIQQPWLPCDTGIQGQWGAGDFGEVLEVEHPWSHYILIAALQSSHLAIFLCFYRC